MARKEKGNETLVGAFLVCGMLMLGYLVVQFGQLGDLFRGSYEVTVVFKEASGVIKGSAVRLGGTKVGEVSTNPVLTDDYKARVTLSIDEKIQLYKGSIFQISTSGFLGDKVIVVTPPEEPDGSFIDPGTELAGGGPGGLELLQGEIEVIAGDARILMSDARTAMIKMDSALDDIRAVSIRLSDSIEKVNNKILSEKNLGNVSSSLANFEEASANFRDLGGELKPLIAEAQSTIQDVRQAALSADKTFQTANEQIARLEPTLNELPQAVKSVTRTADQASATMAKLNSGEGALGSLTTNPEVKDDTESFIKNLRKFGILRYRDAETSAEDDPRERFRGRRR